MAQDLSTRIASKSDTLENWTAKNPTLLLGEVAVVFDGDNQIFKVGDGVHSFNDLPFSFYKQFASELINTDLLKAKSISQGYASQISGIGGIATGYKSQVSANFAQAHGYQATASSDFGYVWNGDNTDASYADHGPGTYSLNPKNGLSGIYIGEDNAAALLSQHYLKSETSSNVQLATKFNTLSTYAEVHQQLSADGYLTQHQSLDNYYRKSETSSATEIQEAFSNIPKPDMSEYAKLSSLEALSAEVDPVAQNVVASDDFYRVYADKMNNLTSCADGMKIVLDNYSFSKSYVMKFTTPEQSEVKFTFYTDTGSGPQLDASMNINASYRFPMNSGYVVEIKFDAMDIRPLAWNGDRQKMTFRTIEWVEE